jgi:hypothetical protein
MGLKLDPAVGVTPSEYWPGGDAGLKRGELEWEFPSLYVI